MENLEKRISFLENQVAAMRELLEAIVATYGTSIPVVIASNGDLQHTS